MTLARNQAVKKTSKSVMIVQSGRYRKDGLNIQYMFIFHIPG
nr:D495 [uncultured bacterium]